MVASTQMLPASCLVLVHSHYAFGRSLALSLPALRLTHAESGSVKPGDKIGVPRIFAHLSRSPILHSVPGLADWPIIALCCFGTHVLPVWPYMRPNLDYSSNCGKIAQV